MNHNAETIWNSCFGLDTPAEVLRAADEQHMTPQDYTMACVIAAEAEGFDCPRSEAFASLCRQLAVTNG